MGLPNLLYVADVAVEATLGGELLLYRLLRKYPSDRLTIVKSNVGRSSPEERLPEVEYRSYDFASERLLNSRFTQWYGSWLHFKAKRILTRLSEIVDEVQPEAILTVCHDYAWLTASEIARKLEIPLHLILHDDIAQLSHRAHPFLEHRYESDLGRVYRQAGSRLCVSPSMEQEYKSRYGVSGTVLYPARGWDAPAYDRPPIRTQNRKREGIRIGYAGGLHAPGFKEALGDVATAVSSVDGEVFVYSNYSKDDINQRGWIKDNVIFKGFVHPDYIIDELREEVDLLFAVSSFEGRYRKVARTNFQSKMVDYTATGLPILIWGPEDSSTVAWAKKNEGVAEVVTSPKKSNLRAAVQRLTKDPEARYEYGANALEVGREYFRPEKAWDTFAESVSM